MRLLSKVLKKIVFFDNPIKIENDHKIINKINKDFPESTKDQEQDASIKIFEQEKLKREILQQAEKLREEIISNAKNEAEKIIKEAHVEKERIIKLAREDGFQEGYNEGFEKGKEKAEKQFLVYFNQFKELEHKLFLDYQEKLKQIEKEALKLSIYIAEKILDKVVEIDDEYIEGLIEKGLRRAREDREVIIRVSLSDYENLKDKIEKLKERIGHRKFSIVKDPLLRKGDLILESSGFTVDASIKTQLNNIEKKLKELGLFDDTGEF